LPPARTVGDAILLADRVVAMQPRPARIVSDARIDLPRARDVASPEFNDPRRWLSAELHG
jgi:NitT/TauT family transport system ATP-binding protein